MNKNQYYIYISAFLTILIPTTGRFVYGFTLMLELFILMMVGTLIQIFVSSCFSFFIVNKKQPCPNYPHGSNSGRVVGIIPAWLALLVAPVVLSDSSVSLLEWEMTTRARFLLTNNHVHHQEVYDNYDCSQNCIKQVLLPAELL